MLDMGFRTMVENWDQYTVFPKRYDHLFRVHRAKVSVTSIISKTYDIFHSFQGLFSSSSFFTKYIYYMGFEYRVYFCLLKYYLIETLRYPRMCRLLIRNFVWGGVGSSAFRA